MKSATATDGAFYHRPTLAQRIARFLGFKVHLGDEPSGVDALPGWAQSKIDLRISFMDRVRLLVTGRLDLTVTHYANRQIDTQKNRVDLRFPAPWERD
jgi:hypothetical protein